MRKLEYLGGKRSVDALIKAFDLSEDAVQVARARDCATRTYCYPDARLQWKQIWKLKPDGQEIEREVCQRVDFHSCVLGVLGFMVKDPPLPPGAPAIPENIRAWKQWWEKNKEQAEFQPKPAQTLE